MQKGSRTRRTGRSSRTAAWAGSRRLVARAAVLGVAVGALMLAGCADSSGIRPQARLIDANIAGAGLAGQGARSDLAAASASVSAGASGNRGTAWPQQQWWRAYADPQLDALIERALAASPDLHIAAARVREAAAIAGLAEAATLPEAGFAASMTRQLFSQHDFIPPPQAGNYDWYNRAAVEANYDLDLWGRQRQALAAAVDEARVAAAEAQMARLALENNLVRSYIQLALNYQLKDIAAATLKRRQEALAITRKRIAIGLATEVESSQIEAGLPALQARIEQHDENIVLIERQLAVLSGQGPASGAALTRPTLHIDGDADCLHLPSAVPAELIGRRPDVAARRWGAEAAAREIDAAKAAFYPNINLMAFMGFQALGFGRFLSNEASIRGYGPALSLPIFDGGRLRANLGARTAAYDMAVESYNATLLRALESVANALTVAESQRRQQGLIDAGVATARKARALAGEGYAAGIGDYLAVLNSEVTLLVAQEQAALIGARRLESYAGLMLALGGGLPAQMQTVPEPAASRTPPQPVPPQVQP